MLRAPITSAIVLAALPAAAALAQPTFEPRVGLRDSHTLVSNPTPNVAGPVVVGLGRYDFTLLFGAFNAQGFSNRGMFNFAGSITLIESPGGSGASIAPRSTSPLVSPYTFGNVHSQPGPRTITFDANRGAGIVEVPWNFGDPAPADVYMYPAFANDSASSGAPDSYHPGLRFHLDITEHQFSVFNFEVTGVMQVITGWLVLAEQVPEPGVPGYQTLIPSGFTSMPIPAPAAAPLLGLAGLFAARRRRN